jgi:tetratricopeptide (TPR) repeat protein
MRHQLFARFCSRIIWRCHFAEYNSGRSVAEHSYSSGAASHPGLFEVTRNRILLSRAIEEAEGYTELGMLEHALRALQRRGSLVHGNGRACYLLGEALRELARYEEALLPLERSADLLPDDIHVLLALGWCYKRTGQLAKAIEVLERAVKVDASEAVLHYNLACYWSLARNRTLALRYLSRALEIDSNFRDMVADEPDFNPLRHDSEFIALTSVIV